MQSSKASCILRVHLAILLMVLLLQSYAEAATWQDFQNRHIAPPPRPSENRNAYCDRMMNARGMTKPKCKPRNTFIHDNAHNVQQVCHGQSTHYRANLFDSIQPFGMTECRNTGTHQGNCKYSGQHLNHRIRVGCSGDPVHFEGPVP